MVQLMDCTLRVGANVVGKGFPDDLTKMILDGLTAAMYQLLSSAMQEGPALTR